MPNILIAGELHPSGLEIIKQNPKYSIDYLKEVSNENFLPYLKNADALIIRTQTLKKNHIEKAKKLKIVSRHGVGYDNVDYQELKKRNIPLTIVGDVNSTSVSEHTMMLIISVFKKIILADFSTRNSLWNYRNNYEPRELYGKNLLIIGFGRIGKKLGKLAKAFGMNIHVYDPYIENKFDEYEIRYFQNLTTALCNADCISLNLPKVDKPIITKENSQYLKHGVVIINTARGELIEEKVLKDGIQEGIISGVGLDVFDSEPVEKNHFLFKYKQVIFTPHQAGLSQEAAERMSIKSINNILDYYDGSLDSSLIVNGVKI